MSVYADIRAALLPLGYPVEANIYIGDSPVYFVLTINSVPINFADNEPQHVLNMCMVHLYCPHAMNTVDLRSDVLRAIHMAGFTYPAVSDASEKEAQHLVFEFQGTGAV